MPWYVIVLSQLILQHCNIEYGDMQVLCLLGWQMRTTTLLKHPWSWRPVFFKLQCIRNTQIQSQCTKAENGTGLDF